MIEQILIKSLSTYAVTFVVVSSSLFEPVRAKVKLLTPRLKVGTGRHPIECRMCFGFWASVTVCNVDYAMILPVYGLAYFLATQERN